MPLLKSRLCNADRNRDCVREIGTWPTAIRCQPRVWHNSSSLSPSKCPIRNRDTILDAESDRALFDAAVIIIVTGQQSLLAANHDFLAPATSELYGEINFAAGWRLSYYVITRLMGEVPSSVRERDRRRCCFFLSRVNLNGIKFISTLLRRLAFRTGCVRGHLQKNSRVKVWKLVRVCI